MATSFWPTTLVEFAQVLGPLATTGAVIVSLYVALRRPKPRLEAHAGLRLIIAGIPSVPHVEVLALSVTNVGSHEATISNIGWRAGPRWRRRQAIQMIDYGPGAQPSAKLPCTLEHGERADYFYRTFGGAGWLDIVRTEGFLPDVLTSRRKMESIRMVVHTSVGEAHLVKPEKRLLDAIWKQQAVFLEGKEAPQT